MFSLNDVAFLGGLQPPVPDPNFANVSLLLHGDGANGSTTIIDSSPSPKTVTAVGNAQISRLQSRFGGASIAFDGNGDYLTTNTSVDFGFGTGSVTVELWARFNALSGLQILVDGREGLANRTGIAIYTSSSSLFVARNDQLNIFSSGVPVVANAWYHVAYARSGSSNYLFTNGVLQQTATDLTDFGPTRFLWVGRNPAGVTLPVVNQYLNGYIDDLRITKGIARYQSTFTPPAFPFPDA
jgi:hypothetical protein